MSGPCDFIFGCSLLPPTAARLVLRPRRCVCVWWWACVWMCRVGWALRWAHPPTATEPQNWPAWSELWVWVCGWRRRACVHTHTCTQASPPPTRLVAAYADRTRGVWLGRASVSSGSSSNENVCVWAWVWGGEVWCGEWGGGRPGAATWRRGVGWVDGRGVAPPPSGRLGGKGTGRRGWEEEKGKGGGRVWVWMWGQKPPAWKKSGAVGVGGGVGGCVSPHCCSRLPGFANAMWAIAGNVHFVHALHVVSISPTTPPQHAASLSIGAHGHLPEPPLCARRVLVFLPEQQS